VRPATLVALLLVAVLGTTGCSSSGESANAERAGTRWVNAVCTDLGRWLAVATAPRPDPGAADKAVVQAARQLELDIDALAPPKTDDGNPAQGEVERLAEGIRSRAGHEPTAALVTAVRGSVDGIRNLTPGGALERGFAHVEACDAVRG
jgi:hypothetical protein